MILSWNEINAYPLSSYYIIMRIVLEKEAYAEFIEKAKAQNLSTRELGKKVIEAYINSS